MTCVCVNNCASIETTRHAQEEVGGTTSFMTVVSDPPIGPIGKDIKPSNFGMSQVLFCLRRKLLEVPIKTNKSPSKLTHGVWSPVRLKSIVTRAVLAPLWGRHVVYHQLSLFFRRARAVLPSLYGSLCCFCTSPMFRLTKAGGRGVSG